MDPDQAVLAPARGGGRVAERPNVAPTSRQMWRRWLKQHHATASGVWLVFAKKHTGFSCPTYSEAVEEALCFGWIDSVMAPVDGDFYRQLFTPRKPRSAWAATNKARVARLIEQGLMTPAGMAAIDLAKQNGSWSTLDAAESLTVPTELRRALNANAQARKHWPGFTDSQRRQFLYWLAGAKREETRAARIVAIVERAAKKITPGQAYEASRRERTRTTTKTTKTRKARKAAKASQPP